MSAHCKKSSCSAFTSILICVHWSAPSTEFYKEALHPRPPRGSGVYYWGKTASQPASPALPRKMSKISTHKKTTRQMRLPPPPPPHMFVPVVLTNRGVVNGQGLNFMDIMEKHFIQKREEKLKFKSMWSLIRVVLHQGFHCNLFRCTCYSGSP